MNEKQNWNKYHQLFDSNKKYNQMYHELVCCWLIDI